MAVRRIALLFALAVSTTTWLGVDTAVSTAASPPGANSPAAAVKASTDDELAGQWAKRCDYTPPGGYSTCLNDAERLMAGHVRALGSATVRQTVTKGNKALVAVTGRVCSPRRSEAPVPGTATRTQGCPAIS